jgi:hypothetical protein
VESRSPPLSSLAVPVPLPVRFDLQLPSEELQPDLPPVLHPQANQTAWRPLMDSPQPRSPLPNRPQLSSEQNPS